MKKDKNSNDEKEKTITNQVEEDNAATDCNSESGEANAGDGGNSDSVSSEVEELKQKLEEKTRQCEEYLNMVQRTAAEFDNYKKRTQKEKEALSLDASIDTISSLLPVVDNLERALKAAEEMEANPLKEGVEMVMRQLNECLGKLGVEPISAVGNSFDPELHNAVMHVTDEEQGENVVLEEFQKGYVMKGKVVRHSMVKVAN